jgi:hypothetical protein
MRLGTRITATAFAIVLIGCSTVPPEAVELSYLMGSDIEALQTSYRQLIQNHFKAIRDRWNTYVDSVWKPRFLKIYIREGELIDDAKVADTDEGFLGVKIWVEEAERQIVLYRRAILDPIDAQEAALKKSVDDAFGRVIRANAIITAHLTSVRKVQEFQDEVLEELKVKGLRDDINKQLVQASNLVQKGIDVTDEAKGKAKSAQEFKKVLEEFLAKPKKEVKIDG